MSHTLTSALRGLVLVAALIFVGTAVAQDADEHASTGPHVAVSAICTSVEDREPVGSATLFPAGTESLACFTEIRDAADQTVVHVWIHEGTTRARVELNVGGSRWRTWSTKKLLPEWTGAWQVKVMTADGVVLETLDFTVE